MTRGTVVFGTVVFGAVVFAVVACRPHRPPSGHGDTSPETDTSATVSNGPWLAPSVQLRGEPNQRIDLDFTVLPAYGGHPGTLIVASGAAPEPYPQTFAQFPMMFLLAGDLPRGFHRVADVWDGVSGVPFLDGFTPAGDVDGDGHMDVWCNNRKLYRGPFVGRELTAEDVLAEAECCWVPIFGDFDADGDGELDALLGNGQTAHVYYGPLVGTLPLWEDNPEVTTFGFQGSWCSSIRGAFRLRDYFGPGVDAVGVGAGLGDDCLVDTRFYELTGPRGRRVTYEQAFSENGTGFSDVTVYDAVDVTGDGRSEVLFGQDRYMQVYENPIQPGFWDTPLAWPMARWVSDVVGDPNGDGNIDLVVEFEDELGQWYGLVLGPLDHDEPMVGSLAVPLTEVSYDHPERFERLFYDGIGERAVDIDGDGLTDLIDLQPGLDQAGYISVWYGADIVAHIARTQP